MNLLIINIINISNMNEIIKELKVKFPFNKETDCKEKYNELLQDYFYEEIISKLTN